MKVAFLAVEAEPFIKVGGLGDVAGSLPPALKKLSVDIRLIMPLHGAIQQQGFSLNYAGNFSLKHRGAVERIQAYTCSHGEVPVYFLDSAFIRSDLPIYSRDDLEDGWRYGLFSLAALTLIKELDWQIDILHANDWHTSMAVYGLAKGKDHDSFFAETKSIISVHNLPYIGSDASFILDEFSLPKPSVPLIPDWCRNAHLPLGLAFADQIVAVSPTYAREIMTPEFGTDLDAFLRSRSSTVSGILNGINYENWDPANDPNLLFHYDINTVEKRRGNRDALQRSIGLPVDSEAMLMGIVSRMDYQKGIDLIPEALYQLLLLTEQPVINWQLVVLGTGDPKIERQISILEQAFPKRVRVSLRFDNRLSHQIYASADLLLIPSRYEPCGLTQMIGMRYGCVPLARATGGLLDTIVDYEASEMSTGFLFSDTTSESLMEALVNASRIFQKKQKWREIQQRGMQADFAWAMSALKYQKLYAKMLLSDIS